MVPCSRPPPPVYNLASAHNVDGSAATALMTRANSSLANSTDGHGTAVSDLVHHQDTAKNPSDQVQLSAVMNGMWLHGPTTSPPQHWVNSFPAPQVPSSSHGG